jgi:hypothetical protein
MWAGFDASSAVSFAIAFVSASVIILVLRSLYIAFFPSDQSDDDDD